MTDTPNADRDGEDVCETCGGDIEACAMIPMRHCEKANREPFPAPQRNDGGQPCGECHIQPGETCDICGASGVAILTEHDGEKERKG